MSKQPSAEELKALIERQTKDIAGTERQRSASRARSTPAEHKKSASQSSNASRQESIPEEPDKGAHSGARRDSAATDSATTRARASPAPATTGIGRVTGKELEADPSSDDEEEEESGTYETPAPRRTRTEAPTGQTPRRQAPTTNGTLQDLQAGNALANFALYADLNEEQQRLMVELEEINGQDSYDSLAAGIGKLKRDEYLVLPIGFVAPNVRAVDVGKPQAHVTMRANIWAQIYALNKAKAPMGADAATFALLRLEAVKAGWLDGQREITYSTPPVDSLRILATDLGTLRDRAQTIKTAAFLVPLVAEHTFRTMGHHFISTDAANYATRYSDTFKSCLMPEIANLLPPAVLYHSALHWVSPRRSREVLMAQLNEQQIPDALRIRSNAAPAGTAILTTTNAILDAMSAVGLDVLFAKYGSFDITGMREMTARIKANPCHFHKSYFAYREVALTVDESIRLEAMKREAEKFAPYAQAFIDVYMRDAALGRARALKKHADGNPIQMRRAAALFRQISRAKISSVEDLFKMNIAATTTDLDE